MKNSVRICVAVIGGLVVAPSVLSAHHSVAPLYDTESEITLTGTVTQFRWNNPHATAMLDAKGSDGMVRNWTVEMSPPSKLRRTGWDSQTLKPGDAISLTGNPRKDAQPRLNFRRINTLNGKPFNTGTGDYATE